MSCPCTKTLTTETDQFDLVDDRDLYELRATVEVEYVVESCEHGDAAAELRVVSVIEQWIFFGDLCVSDKIGWRIREFENGGLHETEWVQHWNGVLDRDSADRERIEQEIVTNHYRRTA